MQNFFSIKNPLLLSLFICLTSQAYSQEVVMPEERASPFAMVTYKNDNLYMKVTYGQPLKKGRAIFGDLVPYGEIWRTGANEATEITISNKLELEGKTLEAGTYTLFAIPEEESWQIIFNSELGQWGAYDYDETKNVLVAKTEQIEQIDDELYEAMTLSIEEAKKGIDLLIMWDQTLIRIPFKFVK